VGTGRGNFNQQNKTMNIPLDQYNTVINGLRTQLELMRKFQAEQAGTITTQANLLRESNNKTAQLFDDNMKLSMLVTRLETEAKAKKRTKLKK
jgi:hypothetical protein